MALGLGTSMAFSGGVLDECTYLKGAYDTNQAGSSGIRMDNQFASVTAASGDTWTVTCNIYLTGSSDTWDAGTDPVSTQFVMGNKSAAPAVPQNTLTAIDVSSGSGMDAGWSDNMFIYWGSSADYPDAGAEFYISDLKIVIKDSGGSVKATNIYDFSSSGDISMIYDYSVDEGDLTKTKGNCLP